MKFIEQAFTADLTFGELVCAQFLVRDIATLGIWSIFSQDEWYIIWKSRGGIMVKGVPREVPRPNPKGPQVPSVLAMGLPEAFHSPLFPQGFSI